MTHSLDCKCIWVGHPSTHLSYSVNDIEISCNLKKTSEILCLRDLQSLAKGILSLGTILVSVGLPHGRFLVETL